MTAFVLIAVVMAVLALVWLLPSLLRHRPQPAADAADTNLAVLRDQCAELDRDAANGLLSPVQLQAAREDLERRVLEDARVPAPTLQTGASKRIAVALAAVLPLVAAGLYWTIGNPAAITLAPAAGEAAKVLPEQIEGMLKKLEARLEQMPDDANGWAMLGRSYLVLQRFAEASTAYERATGLVKDDADLLADYADALAMAQGRRIEGKALQVVEQALRVDPMQWKALAMAGAAAFERKDFRKAIGYWETLQKRPGLDADFLRNIATSIDEARRLSGGKPVAGNAAGKAAAPAAATGSATAATAVRGTVRLDPAFAGRAAPTDIVFIYARAAQGPRAPLAVLRRQVKDLPLEFTLDDSQSMSPELKLSKFPEVVVGARISRDGEARPKSGDLQGLSNPLPTGSTGVVVTINGTVP